MKESNVKLNTKQEKFINFLLEGKYQKEAYILAGYSSKENTAEANASRLIRNAKIVSEINNRLEEIRRLNIINLVRISKLAICRITKLLENDSTNQKIQVEIIKDILNRVNLNLNNLSLVNDKEGLVIYNNESTNMSDEKLERYIKILSKNVDL